jgi:hypothetical protein
MHWSTVFGWQARLSNSTYADSQTGTLVWQDAGLSDVARLIKVCADSLHLVHPSQPAAPATSDMEEALRYGSTTQRNRILGALRQLEQLVGDVRSGV